MVDRLRTLHHGHAKVCQRPRVSVLGLLGGCAQPFLMPVTRDVHPRVRVQAQPGGFTSMPTNGHASYSSAYRAMVLANRTAMREAEDVWVRCVWAIARLLDLRWEMCTYRPEKDVHISASIQRSGAWEPAMVKQMLLALRAHPNSTLIDIGGNIGYYALAAAVDGHAVHTFEPVPLNAAMMQRSIARNRLRGITLHTMALSDRVQEVPMGTDDTNQGGVSHDLRRNKGAAHSMTMLPAVPLDMLLKAPASPLYIKIDIEGAECVAFRGMADFLRTAPSIVGMNMEFGQAKHCCAEWIQDGAIFDVLHKKHGLCPDSGTYKNVCDSKAWDLLWTPCKQTSWYPTGIEGTRPPLRLHSLAAHSVRNHTVAHSRGSVGSRFARGWRELSKGRA